MKGDCIMANMTKSNLQVLNNQMDDLREEYGPHHLLVHKAKIEFIGAQTRYKAQQVKRKFQHEARHSVMTACGLVKVRGNSGRIFYE
jgi:hypothetical protein